MGGGGGVTPLSLYPGLTCHRAPQNNLNVTFSISGGNRDFLLKWSFLGSLGTIVRKTTLAWTTISLAINTSDLLFVRSFINVRFWDFSLFEHFLFFFYIVNKNGLSPFIFQIFSIIRTTLDGVHVLLVGCGSHFERQQKRKTNKLICHFFFFSF